MCLLGTCLLVAGSASPATAAPGQRDPSFGTDGLVYVDFARHQAENSDGLADVWITSSGKVVVAGYSSTIDGDRFGLARLRRDGSLDPRFGGDGRVRTGFGGDYESVNRVIGVGAGRVVAGGTSLTNFSSADGFALARYLPDGSLDDTFGTDGRVLTDVTPGLDHVFDLRKGAGGTLTAAGTADHRVIATRYLVDGTLDASYGDRGVVIAEAPFDSYVSDVALQPDGGMLAAGPGESAWVVRRYDPAGELDLGFGDGGQVVTDWGLGSWPGPNAVTQLADGRFLVVGGTHRVTEDQSYNMAAARYLPDGTLDPEFGTGGQVEVAFPRRGTQWAEADSVLVQPSGKIVLAGRMYRYTGGEGPDALWVVARLWPGGEVDHGFADDGRLKEHFPSLVGSRALAVAGDGSDLVVVGEGYGNGRHPAIVVRYRAR